MEPQIQYAKTEDGVNIAYWTLGEGPPFVHMASFPLSHVRSEWQDPDRRRWYERLAERRMIVRFDHRGTGLSGGDASMFSLDALTVDLEAVVDDRGLERFALLGYMNSGPVAVRYAVHHSERLSHLLLWRTWAKPSAWMNLPGADAMAQLLVKDWVMFTEAYAHQGVGWAEGEAARRSAALMRDSVSPAVWIAAGVAVAGFDVTDLLPRVNVRTLVLDRRQISSSSVGTAASAYRATLESAAKDLASSIPDARLVLLEGESVVPHLGDTDSVLDAISEFLGEGRSAIRAQVGSPGSLVTILFTDVEGSTALTQRLGDAKARDLLREHERMVREALKAHGGSEVKTMGDGFMASFSSATKALECAIAIQRAFAEHNESAEEPIKVRIGLNAGEPISEDDDLFGTAVNLAARICANAEAGQILAPIVVRELAAGKQFMFADLGETELRGFEDPVRLYELRWREAG
jgi:class 3 adenylate cyclase